MPFGVASTKNRCGPPPPPMRKNRTQYPTGYCRHGDTHRTNKRVRPQNRAILALRSRLQDRCTPRVRLNRGSVKKGNPTSTKTRSLHTVLPESTSFRPPIKSVVRCRELRVVTPPDVRVAAPGETRIGVVVCKFVERTSAASFVVLVSEIKALGSTSPAAVVGGMTAVGDASTCKVGSSSTCGCVR